MNMQQMQEQPPHPPKQPFSLRLRIGVPRRILRVFSVSWPQRIRRRIGPRRRIELRRILHRRIGPRHRSRGSRRYTFGVLLAEP